MFEGVIFKDGFLVGIMIVMVIVLVLMWIFVWSNVVMIGEIMFWGWVLFIGGFKEKMIVVLCGGIDIFVILKENEKDFVEILVHIKCSFMIVVVSYMDDVLLMALVYGDLGVYFVEGDYFFDEIYEVLCSDFVVEFLGFSGVN